MTYDRVSEDDDRTLAIVYDYQGIAEAIATERDAEVQATSSPTVSDS
jgi:hypothetical protein